MVVAVSPASVASLGRPGCSGRGFRFENFDLGLRFALCCLTLFFGGLQLSLNFRIELVNFFLQLVLTVSVGLGLLSFHLSEVSLHGCNIFLVSLVLNV